MKKIIGLSVLLSVSGGFMACTSTTNNANLRNANTNTGYVTNQNGSSAATPTYSPMRSTTPMMNSNASGRDMPMNSGRNSSMNR